MSLYNNVLDNILTVVLECIHPDQRTLSGIPSILGYRTITSWFWNIFEVGCTSCEGNWDEQCKTEHKWYSVVPLLQNKQSDNDAQPDHSGSKRNVDAKNIYNFESEACL